MADRQVDLADFALSDEDLATVFGGMYEEDAIAKDACIEAFEPAFGSQVM